MNNFKKGMQALVLAVIFNANSAYSMFSDDPWLTKVMSDFKYLEEHGEGVLEWDIDAWSGQDLSKYWIKTSGEYANSEIEHGNVELVYSRAVSAYWDQQFGIRRDLASHSGADKRNWLSFGYIGTAPYFIEVDARIFVGEESSSQLLIELEREFMITQEWVLTPELEIIANGSTNEAYEEGSGLSEIEFSLMLGYEHNGNRKFQPFFGYTAKRKFGATKRLAQAEGESTSKSEFMIGLHSWF